MTLRPTLPTRLSTLIEERTGIVVHTQMLDDLMLSILRDEPETTLEQLAGGHETDPLWQHIIQALTIGETYFLRDRTHFHLLRTHILPELIDKQRSKRTLNIWSAGCATGEEPYSLAITLKEILPDIDQWEIQILGTDINAQALHTARHGVYRKWAFRHTGIDFQGRYFDPTPDGLSIRPDIQRLVTFRNANLFHPLPGAYFDLTLCRNVLLYFSSSYTHRAEQLLFDTLNPGGWLLLGNAESLRYNRDRWITHLFPGTPAYQKPDRPLKTETGEFVQSHIRETQTSTAVPAIQPQHLYDAAVRALQHEDYADAEQTLAALLDIAPDHPAAHTLQAYLLANRSDFTGAKAEIDRALELDPLLADAHYLQASLCFERDQPNETLTALRAALYCQRNHPLASFLMGNIRAQAGEWAKANRYWQNTLSAINSLTPDSPVSDVSNITAGQLEAMVQDQIHGWH